MSYFTRHWRGSLSLSVSYWVGFVGVGLLVTAIAMPLKIWLGNDRLAVERLTWQGVSVAFLVLEACILLVYLWQVVGTWRSARNHAARGGRRWVAWLAMVLLLISAASLAGRYVANRSEYAYLFRSALGIEMEAPALARVGDSIQIDGKLASGTARRLERLLAVNPEVTKLRVNSPGGYMYEADLIAGHVAERGMMVIVNQECLSACVVVFAAGIERIADRLAVIGIHRVAQIGGPREGIEGAAAWQPLVARGFPQAAVDRAALTPTSDLWTVDVVDLHAQGFVTGIISDEGTP